MLSTGQSLAFGEYLPLINAAVLFILVIKVFFWAAPKRTRCYDEALGALVDMHDQPRRRIENGIVCLVDADKHLGHQGR